MATSTKPRVSFRVVILSPDKKLLTSVVNCLQDKRVVVEQFTTAKEVLAYLAEAKVDLLIFGLAVDIFDPLAFIQRSIEVSPATKIVLGIARERRELALDFLNQGVNDLLDLPWLPEDIAFQIKKYRSKPQPRVAAETSEYGFDGIIGRSAAIRSVFDTISRVAPFDTTLLITGSSGTGKEMVAQSIHRNSNRSTRPFVAINCGAIPEHLIESELFGHKKGAFTDAVADKKGLFEEANGGTIFLDEIGELSPQMQVKLLRVLQERSIQPVGDSQAKPVDVRVLAATLTDLERSISTGSFREDLYYRLHVVHIELPDLCERYDDIELLVDFFLAKHGRRLGIEIPNVASGALKILKNYSWPGNVRELENCIERALVLHDGGLIDRADLPDKLLSEDSNSHMPKLINSDSLSIKEHVRFIEQQLITKALQRTHGNRTHAAKLLEISHRSLLYKLKEYDLKNVGKYE